MKWEKQPLGKYIDVISGYAFKSKDFLPSGIPVIKIKNVSPPEVSLEDLSYISVEIANDLPKFALQYGDVLIALTGSHINQMASVVGRVARVKYRERSMFNQRVGKIVVKDADACDLNYVYYYLSQDQVKISLARKAGGAANQANKSPSDVKGLAIPFPSVEIQHRIADILSAYDDLIENNQRQIKLLEEAALRLYKEWFVQLRFPGHETTPIVDGVPEGWKLGTVKDLVEFKRGKTITKAVVKAGNIPVVAGGLEPAYFHNAANTASPVVTVSASGANAGFVRMYHRNIWASDCSYIDIEASRSLHFVYCYLKNNKASLDNLQRGAAQPHVYPKDINAMAMIVPQEPFLNEFYSIVEPQFSCVGKLENEIECLRQARDKLLPKLMSGEIEV